MPYRQKLTLDSPRIYEIRVPGELDESWAEWDGKMTVTIGHSGSSSAFLFYSPADRRYIGGTLNQLENQGRPFRLMARVIRSLDERVPGRAAQAQRGVSDNEAA